MTDWFNELTPQERSEWDAIVDHFRRDALKKIDSSALYLALVPEDELDLKFAMELGAGILLNKPLLVVVPHGRQVSGKLRRVADEVVEVDFDTEAGQRAVADALRRMMAQVGS